MEFVGTSVNNKQTFVQFRCPKYTEAGIQEAAWAHFRTATFGCSYCSGKHKTTESFKEEIALIDPTISILGNYTSMRDRIEVCCLICGHVWSPEARSLKQGQGCPICAHEKRAAHRKKSHDTFVSEMAAIAPNILITGKYQGTHKMISCTCTIHHCTWESYPCNLLNQTAGCPECAIERFNNQPSKGERLIAEWLRANEIAFHPEVTLDGCRYKRPLRFDFYLDDLNAVIEFDGLQHFQYVPSWSHGNPNYLAEVQQRDAIKDAYCAEHHIRMIRIPYTQIDSVGDILSKNLQGVM